MKIKALKSMIGLTAVVVMLSGGMVAHAAGSYTTKPGDNLSKIAKEIYGDPIKWRLIYESNKDQIKDPNLIWANQTFIIPDLENAAAETTPQTQAAEELPAESQAPVTETQTPAATQQTETPAAQEAPVLENTISPEEAQSVFAGFITSLLTVVPDETLAFFDTNGDMNFTSQEYKQLVMWAVDLYNIDADKSTISDVEKTAAGTALINGKYALPSEVYFVQF